MNIKRSRAVQHRVLIQKLIQKNAKKMLRKIYAKNSVLCIDTFVHQQLFINQTSAFIFMISSLLYMFFSFLSLTFLNIVYANIRDFSHMSGFSGDMEIVILTFPFYCMSVPFMLLHMIGAMFFSTVCLSSRLFSLNEVLIQMQIVETLQNNQGF